MKRTFILGLVAATLVGCGGPQPTLASLVGVSKSWMSRNEPKANALVYVSDRNLEDVDVYDYTNGKQVGTLTGFTTPRGQCVDAKGDVWIADGTSVVEYAHGGAAVLKRLTSANDHYSCSVARNGDLAVVAANTGSLESFVEIWPNASGSPIVYYPGSSNCRYYADIGYGNSGLLYIEANDFPSSYRFYVCAASYGYQTFQNVKFRFASALQSHPMWDGRYMTINVVSNYAHTRATMYRVSPASHGKSLDRRGKTILGDTCSKDNLSLELFFLVGKANTPVNTTQAHTVVGFNAYCPGRLEFWHYPGGGVPYKSLPLGASLVPAGDSVSIAQ